MKTIRKYLIIRLILLISAVLILVASAFLGTKVNQENASEDIVNNSSSTDASQVATNNETDGVSIDPVSIPLERPPFIDKGED